MIKKTRKQFKVLADKLWSEIVRSVGLCEKCGKRINLQAAHIFSRRYSHIRHDRSNGICLCAGCHFWAHQNPIEFAKWVIEYLGDDLIDKLEKKKLSLEKVDYEKIYLNLRESQ